MSTTRDKLLKVRCTSAELDRWQTSASRAGLELSEWVRRRLGHPGSESSAAVQQASLLDVVAEPDVSRESVATSEPDGTMLGALGDSLAASPGPAHEPAGTVADELVL